MPDLVAANSVKAHVDISKLSAKPFTLVTLFKPYRVVKEPSQGLDRDAASAQWMFEMGELV